jgi:hypothetical protein
LHIAAQGKGADAVIGLAAFEAGDPGSKTQGKDADAHAQPPGHQKMPEFMEKDQSAQDKHHRENTGHHAASVMACSVRVPDLGVEGQDGLQILDCGFGMNFEHACDESGDAGKGNALLQKGLHRDFVGRVEHHRMAGAGGHGLPGQAQAGKAGFIRGLEGQAAQTLAKSRRSRPMRKRRG